MRKLVVGAGVETHINVGQFPHDGRESLDRQSDGAAFFDLGLDFTANAQVEIGRRERDVILLRLDQHVAEDGHRGFGADNVENLGEAVAEVVAVDLEFHEWGRVIAMGDTKKLTKANHYVIQ